MKFLLQVGQCYLLILPCAGMLAVGAAVVAH